jgi:hypothetical protein
MILVAFKLNQRQFYRGTGVRLASPHPLAEGEDIHRAPLSLFPDKCFALTTPGAF